MVQDQLSCSHKLDPVQSRAEMHSETSYTKAFSAAACHSSILPLRGVLQQKLALFDVDACLIVAIIHGLLRNACIRP